MWRIVILMMLGLCVVVLFVILDSGVNIDVIKVVRMLKKMVYGNLVGILYVMERLSYFMCIVKLVYCLVLYGFFYNFLLLIGNCSLVVNCL